MKNKLTLTIALLTAGLLAAGCNTANTTIVKAPATTLNSKTYEVKRVPSKHQGLPFEILERELFKTLQKNGFDKQGGSDLQIVYQITHFNPGVRILRYLVGFGAGSGETLVNVKVMVKGQLVAEATIDTHVRWGQGGGDPSIMLENAGEEIAEFVIGLRKKKG